MIEGKHTCKFLSSTVTRPIDCFDASHTFLFLYLVFQSGIEASNFFSTAFKVIQEKLYKNRNK